MCMDIFPHSHTPTRKHVQTSQTVWQLSSQSDELCLLYFMTSLLLISSDKTTGGFTHQVCVRHIVSRCERKKNGGEKIRGQEVDEGEAKG